jgi:serine/threonine protein phosphatase 1
MDPARCISSWWTAEVPAGVHLDNARLPPGLRLYAIGDVHGCRDLLMEMHARIDAELERDAPGDWRIVHVGDYCDRGPDTKGVIDFLIARMAWNKRIVCLRGNHDEGFVSFLEARSGAGIFINNGGETTAASYGVRADFSSAAAVEQTRESLLAGVPHAHRAWLADLPHAAELGDFFFCHAGIRPGVPLDVQDANDLVWIRETFLDDPRLHPKVIVHGHTPSNEVELRPNRVNVDTRAFASGRLSALKLDGAGKSVVEVSRPPL